MFVCLFVCGVFFVVCLGFFIPLDHFSSIWRLHYYRTRAANVNLCATLIPIEQWGFFSVQHLLWYGTSFYNGVVLANTVLSQPVTLFRTCQMTVHWLFAIKLQYNNYIDMRFKGRWHIYFKLKCCAKCSWLAISIRYLNPIVWLKMILQFCEISGNIQCRYSMGRF